MTMHPRVDAFQLPTSADNVTLLAFAAKRRRAAAAPGGYRCRSISPARRAHSRNPRHAVAAVHGTDRRTDIVPLHRRNAMRAASIRWKFSHGTRDTSKRERTCAMALAILS